MSIVKTPINEHLLNHVIQSNQKYWDRVMMGLVLRETPKEQPITNPFKPYLEKSK